MGRVKPRRWEKWLPRAFRRSSSLSETSPQKVSASSSFAPSPSERGNVSEVLPARDVLTVHPEPSTKVIAGNHDAQAGTFSDPVVLMRRTTRLLNYGATDATGEHGASSKPAVGGKSNNFTTDLLAAPPKDLSTTAGSTSPYRKDEVQSTNPPPPRLLDPDGSVESLDLWKKAYDQLSQDENMNGLVKKFKAVLEDSLLDSEAANTFEKQMVKVLKQKIATMKKKQWVIQWDQKSIIVRDQAERIVKLIQVFSGFGDGIAQIDPIHVGIPWAGVSAILTLILKDSTQHQAVMDGLENISRLIAKYIAVEDIFARSMIQKMDHELSISFERSILKVYSSILYFQIKAILYFHHRTTTRIVSNIVKSVDWAALLLEIKEYDVECLTMTSTIGIANMTASLDDISTNLSGIKHKIGQMQEVNDRLDKLYETWDTTQISNAKIIAWISDVQVGEDHQRVRAKLGHRHLGAGQWFLQNSDFKSWKSSSHDKFWLQGSVGTGKTSLASIVINDLVKFGDGTSIAFFYCSRGLGDAGNDPTSIFRSLVAQLSYTEDGGDIYQIIKKRHSKESNQYVKGNGLLMEDCKDLLIRLMELRGKTAIIIDGVDECSKPIELLDSLHWIWERNQVLKIFVTSRLDVPVMEVFPGITTVRSDFGETAIDMENYIRKEFERTERRNPKVITDELGERMVNILIERAQGMFRWVELQLNLLINPERRIRFRQDFEDRLRQLELGSGQEVLESLRDTYDEIYKNNTRDGPYSQKLVEKSLKWALCCARPLKIWELSAAVSVEEEQMVETELVVNLCSNFLLVDQRGFVQLAHLSVREYLEVKVVDGIRLFAPQESHAEVATTCLLYWMKIIKAEFTDDEASVGDETDDITKPEGRSSESDDDLPLTSPRAPGAFNKEVHLEEIDEVIEAVTASDKTSEGENETVHPVKTEDGITGEAEHGHKSIEITEDSKTEVTSPDEPAKPKGPIFLTRSVSEVKSADEESATPNDPPAEPDSQTQETEFNLSADAQPDETTRKNPYAGPNGDYFPLSKAYSYTDNLPSLPPDRAFNRFQRYAAVYWAYHYQASKTFSPTLQKLVINFLGQGQTNPVFEKWETALLNEIQVTHLPSLNGAPVVFLPGTGHPGVILDAEPIYKRWSETIHIVGGEKPLRISIGLVCCFYGFVEVLDVMGRERWRDALVESNHEGIVGKELAKRNGCSEILDSR